MRENLARIETKLATMAANIERNTTRLAHLDDSIAALTESQRQASASAQRWADRIERMEVRLARIEARLGS